MSNLSGKKLIINDLQKESTSYHYQLSHTWSENKWVFTHGSLESLKLLTQTVGKGQIIPERIQKTPNPNSRQRMDNSMHGKQTDGSTCKNQQAWMRICHTKMPLGILSHQQANKENNYWLIIIVEPNQHYQCIHYVLQLYNYTLINHIQHDCMRGHCGWINGRTNYKKIFGSQGRAILTTYHKNWAICPASQ